MKKVSKRLLSLAMAIMFLFTVGMSSVSATWLQGPGTLGNNAWYALTSSATALQLGSTQTVSFWVRTPSAVSNSFYTLMVGKMPTSTYAIASTNYSVFLKGSGSGGALSIYSLISNGSADSAANTCKVQTTTTVPLNSWNHIAMTYDKTASDGIYMKVYLNGTLCSVDAANSNNISITPITTSDQFIIGNTNVTSPYGNINTATASSTYITNVRLYKSTLTSAQILTDMTSQVQNGASYFTKIAGTSPTINGFASDGVTAINGTKGGYGAMSANNLLIYDSQGGTALGGVTVANGGTITTAPTAPTKSGCVFVGWYTDIACTTAFVFGAAGTGTAVTANTTLYAKWSTTVTFDSQGGSDVTAVTVDSGSTLTKPTNPTKSDSTFYAWYKDSSFVDPWNFTYDTVTAPTTLYAKWIPATSTLGLKLGDYVQMGQYNGTAIKWRVMDIDANGPLLVSDGLLPTKAYDVAGATGSHTRGTGRTTGGSDFWEDSNIRSWIQSSSPAGQVTWTCGNAPSYSAEKGFLADGNFTAVERNAIKSVSQKEIINAVDKPAVTYSGADTYLGITNSLWTNLLTTYKYTTAASYNVTDTMFFLDVKQYKDLNVSLGTSASNKGYFYFLRTPYANFAGGTGVFVANSASNDKAILTTAANSVSIYVRPAFYLNESTTTFATGDGAVATPYTVVRATITNLTKNANVVSATITPTGAKIIIALYDANDVLLSADIQDTTNSTATYDYDVTGVTGTIKKVRAYLWNDITSIQPLTSSYLLTL